MSVKARSFNNGTATAAVDVGAGDKAGRAGELKNVADEASQMNRSR
jgi:hypothetical protein